MLPYGFSSPFRFLASHSIYARTFSGSQRSRNHKNRRYTVFSLALRTLYLSRHFSLQMRATFALAADINNHDKMMTMAQYLEQNTTLVFTVLFVGVS